MIRLIREHNTLNGLRFSMTEFLVASVIAVGLAIYLATTGEVALAIALLGVEVNCLVVAAVGVRSLRAGEPDRSLRATFSPSTRARILEDYPHAQRATWILAGLALIPFAVLALAVAPSVRDLGR